MKKLLAPTPTKFIRITVKKQDRAYELYYLYPDKYPDPNHECQYAWATDEQIEAYRYYGYGVEEICDTKELGEIRKFQRNTRRGPITTDDISDALIDLYLLGKGQ